MKGHLVPVGTPVGGFRQLPCVLVCSSWCSLGVTVVWSCKPCPWPVRLGAASCAAALPRSQDPGRCWVGAAKHKYAASHRQGGDGKNPVPQSKSEAILRASNYYPSALSRAHFQKIMQGKNFFFLFFLPRPEQTPAMSPWAQLLACSRPSAPNMGSRLSPGQRNTAMHKIHLRCNGEQTAPAACVGSLLCVWGILRHPTSSTWGPVQEGFQYLTRGVDAVLHCQQWSKSELENDWLQLILQIWP